MKKFIFYATLVALFTSCMKDDVVVDAVQRTEDFIATFADDTRADLDGTAVVWNADDHLTIFTKTSHNRQYKVKDLSANGRSATFEYVGYTGSDKTAISNNYAVYPYDAEATILGDVITTTLASEQTYNAECDLTYALMSAKSATNNFSFVNSGALLRFNISTILPDTFDLNYIKVSSQSHNIAGEVTIDTNDHLAVVTNNGTNEIKLVEINETIDSDVKSFYIAMPAISFEKSDLSITFSFADGDKTFALPAFDLEQGKIKSIDYSIKDAEEFTGSTPGEDVPAAAKPANNEIWYTNGSTTEPTAPYKTNVFGVNIVSNTYDAKKECWVIKFDGEVTTIGEWAFGDCISLTSVTIPDSVTTIGERAFYYCSSLTSVTIPDNVTTIGRFAFYGCTGELIVNCNIPSPSYSSYGAFYGSQFTSVTIGDSVTTIGEWAFTWCRSLTSVTIGDSVTTIGECAFSKCSSLTEFNGKFASEDGRCLIIDGTLNSFAPAGLTEYTIPDSITTIGDSAFLECSSLISVTIGDSVTLIGNGAFRYCSSLTSVTIGDSVTTIGADAFFFCSSLTSITIPDSVTTIRKSAFLGCNDLTSVTIGDSVTSIGESAFERCSSLTSVTIGDSVTTIGDYAFEDCSSLTSITIPDSVTTIGEGAFGDCSSLTSVTIPDSVTTIEDHAFAGCSSLTSVTIPDSVTTIGRYAFSGCSSLTSVTIGDSVTTIGEGAFATCSSLTQFNGKFASEDGRCLIIDGTLVAFARAGLTGYSIPDSVTTIGDDAFAVCSSLTSVTIPDSVTTIGDEAFCLCYHLTSVTIPDSVTTIGAGAFSECSSLESVIIPDSVTTIGRYAFYECSSLTSVTIGDSVTTIGDGAFYECSSLTSVYCKGTTPPVASSLSETWIAFDSNGSGRKIYVPMESVEVYKSASGWKEYADAIVGYNF